MRLIHYTHSQLDVLYAKKDAFVVFGPWDCFTTGGTYTMTRNASGDYSLNKTAAADTTYVNADLTLLYRSTLAAAALKDDGTTYATGVANVGSGIEAGPGGASLPTGASGGLEGPTSLGSAKGLQLTSIDVIYSVGTAALTSLTPALQTITFANNAANVVATAAALTGTLAVATQANPYVTNLTLPATWQNTKDVRLNLELAVVAAATSVFKFYGFVFYFNHNYI